MSWEKPGAAAPHKPAVKAARSHATISRIASLEQAQPQLREQAPLIKKLKRQTKDQASSTIDQLRDENAELRREPAKLQAMLDQIFETYEWQGGVPPQHLQPAAHRQRWPAHVDSVMRLCLDLSSLV